MNRVLRLVKGGKASTHATRGKRDTVRSEQVALRASSRDLGWYLADNVSDMTGRGGEIRPICFVFRGLPLLVPVFDLKGDAASVFGRV